MERIESNPEILGGKPIIKGTRIPVYQILKLLAAGYTIEKVVEDYPDITKEDVKAAIDYAEGILEFQEVKSMKRVWY